ncbi:hypothetical protein FRC12_015489, partial [Ceratobasidium sp. 428]
IGNVDEFEDDGDFAIQTLKRLAADEMPYDSRHRHSSSAGIYHMQATELFWYNITLTLAP